MPADVHRVRVQNAAWDIQGREPSADKTRAPAMLEDEAGMTLRLR